MRALLAAGVVLALAGGAFVVFGRRQGASDGIVGGGALGRFGSSLTRSDAATGAFSGPSVPGATISANPRVQATRRSPSAPRPSAPLIRNLGASRELKAKPLQIKGASAGILASARPKVPGVFE